jgi:hypothetical protein
MPPVSALPPVVVNPTTPPQGWGYDDQNRNNYGPNNRRAQSYGTSNYAPWNTSPTCSDTTSQYYNPTDPSCATGNQPTCTNPTYPGYNPAAPQCAAITNAASVAAANAAAVAAGVAVPAAATNYSSLLLYGGAALLLFMMFKK